MNDSDNIMSVGVACLVAVLLLATAIGGSSAQATTVEIEVSDAPESVTQGDEFTAEYSIENVGNESAAYTIELNNSRDNVSISGISGDIRSKSIDNSTATASTEFTSPDDNATVSVRYVVSENATGEETLEAEVREPLSGSTDTTTHTFTIAEADTGPSVTLVSGPDSVEENSTFALEYRLNATDSALTINASPTPSGFDVIGFGGAIETQDLNSVPPSATSSYISGNANVTVTVEYKTQTDILDRNQSESEQTLGLAVTAPLSGEVSNNQTTVVLTEPTAEPTDPTERAQQITQVDNSDEIDQNDITNTITRFERGESVNGVSINQSDITTVITLFERR
ncbi:hypothetical protein [Halorubrum persicum]|uniref:hypothetical protein n=1 Tax=Halorubrum persicum TaxID=1383844 RepID=UPI001181B53D|nr:hypothetical protein [Halorubrum persicum]